MLQSVPDPFDSYGPPQAKDKIFSILAPLSIMSNATGSSASPMAGTTPERDLIDSPPSSATNKITSWLPGTNGALYIPESTEWAGLSPSSTPPRSTSPPSAANRRHPVPPTRKSESKLRAMLPVIDEVRPRYEIEGNNDSPSGSALLSSGEITVPDPGPDLSWSYTSYGESPCNNGDGQLTPRNPTSAPSSSPSLSDSPQKPNVEHEHDDQKQIEPSVSWPMHDLLYIVQTYSSQVSSSFLISLGTGLLEYYYYVHLHDLFWSYFSLPPNGLYLYAFLITCI